MSLMANYWAEKAWEITLLTFDDGQQPPHYALDPRVHHQPLALEWPSRNTYQAFVNNLTRTRRLRASLRASRPDTILSFLDKTNLQVLLATRGLGFPVVISERTVPGVYKIGRAWETLRGILYPLADAIVVQTRAVRDAFSPRIQARCRVVPNPVLAPPGPLAPSSDERRIVAVGRLDECKQFNLLIRAFARIARSHQDWFLEIWGEGPERAKLEALRNEFGLSSRVRLPGATQDVYRELRRGGIFALTSRFEGFPNALCEAMAVGLPVVSFDCPHGPREIIRDGVDGVLVLPGDLAAFSEKLVDLIDNPERRRSLACRAPDVLQRFGLERVMQEWEHVLSEVVPAKTGKG